VALNDAARTLSGAHHNVAAFLSDQLGGDNTKVSNEVIEALENAPAGKVWKLVNRIAGRAENQADWQELRRVAHRAAC